MKIYEMYRDFMGMMKRFIKENRGKYAFLCLDLQEFVDWIEGIGKAKQIKFMEYALEFHNEYAMDVINGTYKHIGDTETVWELYVKQAKKGNAIKVLATALCITLISVVPVKANGVDNSGMFHFENGAGHYVEKHIYPATGIVTEMEVVSEDETMLTIRTANGNPFEYVTEDGDWFLRDLASMLIDSKGTEEVSDDEVISCKYAGVIQFFEIKGE